MEVKTDFSDWIKNRIAKYDFVQGVDFIAPEKKGAQKTTTYGQEKIEYFISLDMAKELSMVENNAQDVDFITLYTELSEKSHGKFASDFAVTIEFAKHLAMMAKTQRAHSITLQKHP